MWPFLHTVKLSLKASRIGNLAFHFILGYKTAKNIQIVKFLTTLLTNFYFSFLGPHLASLDLNRTLFDKSAAEERSSAESVKAKGPGLGVNSISGLNGIR